MGQNTKTERSAAILLITSKLRERLAQSQQSTNATFAEQISHAPTVKSRYVMVDLSDKSLRDSLSQAVKPWMNRALGIPPALVGSARRIESSITSYERKISNFDLFEDCRK